MSFILGACLRRRCVVQMTSARSQLCSFWWLAYRRLPVVSGSPMSCSQSQSFPDLKFRTAKVARDNTSFDYWILKQILKHFLSSQVCWFCVLFHEGLFQRSSRSRSWGSLHQLQKIVFGGCIQCSDNLAEPVGTGTKINCTGWPPVVVERQGN